MNTDQRSPGTDDAAGRGDSGPALGAIREPENLARDLGGHRRVWWRFFDWLAVVSWKTLLLVSFLGLILAGMLQAP